MPLSRNMVGPGQWQGEISQTQVFEAVGITELDAELAAYDGRSDIQASIAETAAAGPVAQAAERLETLVANDAPLVYSSTYSERYGCHVYFKDESELCVGSFKLRGAFNKLATLSVDRRSQGVVASSAGNHAQGVAKAAALYGVPVTVFMPETTSPEKVGAVRALGANVRLTGATFEMAHTAADRFLQEHAAQTFVHPFDDEAVIAGQGTVGREIFSRLAADEKQASHVFVPVGGGGLLAGLSLAAMEAGVQTQLHGVEPAGSVAFAKSRQAGERVRLRDVHTQAEGSAVAQLGRTTFRMLRQAKRVNSVVVSEDALLSDMVELNEYFQKPVECTGALAFSGMQQHHEAHGFEPDDIVVAIISGRHRNEANYAAARARYGDRSNRLTIAS